MSEAHYKTLKGFLAAYRNGKVKIANIHISEDYTWITDVKHQIIYQGDGYAEVADLWKIILGDVQITIAAEE